MCEVPNLHWTELELLGDDFDNDDDGVKTIVRFQVTYVTPFPTNKTTEKYHEVDLSKSIDKIDGE